MYVETVDTVHIILSILQKLNFVSMAKLLLKMDITFYLIVLRMNTTEKGIQKYWIHVLVSYIYRSRNLVNKNCWIRVYNLLYFINKYMKSKKKGDLKSQ